MVTVDVQASLLTACCDFAWTDNPSDSEKCHLQREINICRTVTFHINLFYYREPLNLAPRHVIQHVQVNFILGLFRKADSLGNEEKHTDRRLRLVNQ